MVSFLVAMRAALFASGFVYLWAWVALAVEGLDGRIQARLPEWATVPGLVVMAAGVALAFSCIAIFVAVGRGTPAPFDAPRRFVAVGPYRYVRNPMYVGGFLVLAGWALYRQSPSVLLFAAAWLGLVHLFVLGYEEPTLHDRFGLDYERYLERVPRWIPLRLRPAAVLLAISLAAIPSTAAQRPDLTGVWNMNRAKSDFGLLPGPESRTDRVDHREPSLKVTRTQGDGGTEVSADWACATDGAECLNTIRGDPMKSTARLDGDVLLIDSRRTIQDEDVLIQEKWTLSSDRNAITIRRHLASRTSTTWSPGSAAATGSCFAKSRARSSSCTWSSTTTWCTYGADI